MIFMLNAQNWLLCLTVVFAMILSVVLHELAHGLAAIRQGDLQPRTEGFMTLNPLKHMNYFALLTTLFLGVGWGKKTVDSSRCRMRRGWLIVTLAGPVANLLIAFVLLTWLAFGQRYSVGKGVSDFSHALIQWLQIVGILNLLLCFFSFIPLPPLDGAAILGKFSQSYETFINAESNRHLVVVAFVLAFIFSATILLTVSQVVGEAYVDFVQSIFFH